MEEELETLKSKIKKQSKFNGFILSILALIILFGIGLIVLLNFHSKIVMDSNGMKSWVGASLLFMMIVSFVLAVIYCVMELRTNHQKKKFNLLYDSEEPDEELDEEYDNDFDQDFDDEKVSNNDKAKNEQTTIQRKPKIVHTKKEIDYQLEDNDCEMIFTSIKKLRLKSE